MKEKLNDLRQNYDKYELVEDNIPDNPYNLFKLWFDDTKNSNIVEANAMTLGTVNELGQVKLRVVLLKEYGIDGFTFFTNYNSEKGKNISFNNKASILFFWDILHRQVRIEGEIVKISREETLEYFNSRPYESKIGAIASYQSLELESRESLEIRYQSLLKEYPENPPCPENWGGYILKANYIEFWQGRANRLHDRIVYELLNNDWQIKRLYP